MTALITTDEFRALRLGLKGPKSMPEDDELLAIIDTASVNIEETLDRKLASQSHVETYRGKDSYRLMVREYPVTALTSVSWYDETSGQSETMDVTGMTFEDWGVIRWKVTGVDWFRSSRFYTVTYVAGYAEIPATLKRAVAIQTTILMAPNFMGPQGQAELVPDATQAVVDLIDTYRRRVLRA